jgi:hypothetical protein
MKFLEIKDPADCPYRLFDFDDPNDSFSMDYMCKHPSKKITYCDKNKIPANCPLNGDDNIEVEK